MKPDDIIRLRHTIEAAQTVARYIDGRRREDLDTDSMLAFALIRCRGPAITPP